VLCRSKCKQYSEVTIYLMPPYGSNGSLSGTAIFSDEGDKTMLWNQLRNSI